MLGRDTGTVVGHLDAHPRLHHGGLDREHAAAMRLDHSVLRVLDHVKQDFLQVIVVRPDVGHRLEIGPDGDPFRFEARFLERHHFPDLLRHLAARPSRRAVLGEEDEIPHDGGGALGRGVDDAQRLFHLGAHGSLSHQVELRHDDGQGIVDLMRHPGGQAVDGGQPLRLDHFDLGAAEVVELAVDLAVEAGIVEGEADLIRHALEQRDLLVGEAVLGLPAEGQGAENAVTGPDGHAHESADAVGGDGHPRRGQQVIGDPDVVDPTGLSRQRYPTDQALTHGQLDIDPAQLVTEASVSPQEEAIAVGGDEMKARDLVARDMGQGGERTLQHLVEVQRTAHGFIHRPQDLQVPNQGRRRIVSHDWVKGSKSSATGLGAIH